MKVLVRFTVHGSCVTVQTGQAFRRTKIIGRTITSRGRDYTAGKVHKDNFIVTYFGYTFNTLNFYSQLSNINVNWI